MKRSIIVIATALTIIGASASVVASAQDHPDSAEMQRVTVTASPGQFETYELPLDTGFALQARVGNTHRQYMEAARSTERLETLRMEGRAQVPAVTVAIDNSGRGQAWQYRIADKGNHTLAIVDVYCRHTPIDGNHCRMVSLPVAGRSALAGLPAGRVPLAQVQIGAGH